MLVHLGSLHYIYLILIVLIIIFMILKKDITILCLAGIFVLGAVATKSIPVAIAGVFNSLAYAITQLIFTILIISVITSMSIVLTKTGINETMVKSFTKLIKTPTSAYFTIGLIMLVLSLFFWPSPAIALVGALLLPAAKKAGLPAMGAAICMNLFGHGFALSGDFVIQAAPKLTADGAGMNVSDIVSASVPLVLTMGIVTTLVAFFMLKKDIKNDTLSLEEVSKENVIKEDNTFKNLLSDKEKKFFSIFIALLFIFDIYIMYKLNLQGGNATALVGGTALFILTFLTIYIKKREASPLVISYIVEGFMFGFKVFGPVIPIAAFFYLGDAGFIEIFGKVLPKGSNGLVNDLGVALSSLVPLNAPAGAATLTSVGVITGLDGSGFSGISLAGSVAKIFGIALKRGTATLTALGQISAIWVGGGTIIPWALLPVAAICNIDPFELARRNLKPVIIGLSVTTLLAMFLI